MNKRIVLAKAQANDEFLNELATNWKKNTACKNNPVVDLIAAHRALIKVVILILMAILAFCAGTALAFLLATHKEYEVIITVAQFICVITVMGCLISTIAIEDKIRPARANAKAFVESLSIVDSHLDQHNDGPDTTFWDLGKRGSSEWLKIGNNILTPMTNEIKGIEKFAWNEKKVAKLKAQFIKIHSRLGHIGFAHKDQASYWQ